MRMGFHRIVHVGRRYGKQNSVTNGTSTECTEGKEIKRMTDESVMDSTWALVVKKRNRQRAKELADTPHLNTNRIKNNDSFPMHTTLETIRFT
jgi:hypothetical protein